MNTSVSNNNDNSLKYEYFFSNFEQIFSIIERFQQLDTFND